MSALPPGFVLDSAPAAGPTTGPVYGPPPKPPAPDSLAELARLDLSREDNALAREKFDYEKQQDAAKLGPGGGEDAARGKILRLVNELNKFAIDANDNGGFMETGTSGQVGRYLPGQTAGKDLAENAKTIRANFAFDALQAMRDASKTGGALGQVSEIELQLLESAVSNINPDQSHQQVLQNVETARQAYLSKLAAIDPQLAAKFGYDAAKAEAAYSSLNDQYNKEFGFEGGINDKFNVDRTTPAATARPADIDAIMQKYGAGQ